MTAFELRMWRLLLVLSLVGQLACMVEGTNGKDPDDYDDLDDEDDDLVFEEEDEHIDPSVIVRPSADEKLTAERYFRLLRPRLGHFERYPELRKLYEDYFEKSIQGRDAAMRGINKAEDWRSLRPTAEFCVSFLTIFKSKGYMINKPLDLIPLDACLEWVFLDEITVPKGHPDYDRQERAVSERELDLKQMTSAFTTSKVANLRRDETLESIYTDTLFSIPDSYETVDNKKVAKENGVPRRMRLKLKKYLLRLLDIHAQNPGKGCHSLWLDAYTSFMEQVYLDCAGQLDCVHFGDERLDEDKYFRLVAESTRQSSINCYKTMQSSILSLMRKSYDSKSSAVRFSRAVLLGKGKLERQYESQSWTKEMVNILQLVSGQEADKPISLSDVVKTLWEIKGGDADESTRFLSALGEYAIMNADMKDTSDDPYGLKRYTRSITRLCKPYIDEKLFLEKAGAIDLDEEEIKNKEPFLFYHLIYSLIRLTNHESIYDITKDQFEQDVLKNKWEALYLTTVACQVMSTTYGELSQDTNENAYKVSFQYDSAEYFEDWPLEVMNERLVKVAGKVDQALTIEPKRAKLDFRSKNTKPIEEDEEQVDAAAAALWSDGDAGDEGKSKKMARSGSGRKSNTLAGVSDSISQRFKKTFGRWKLGGGSGSGSNSYNKPKRGGYIMSEAQIRQFHKAYGKWPDLPDNILQIYPDLPAECLAKPPQGQQQPQQPVGLQMVANLQQQQQQQVVMPGAAILRPGAQVAPAAPTGANQQPAGYWASNWNKEDNLPAWKSTPETVLPPRRTRDNLF